MMNIPQCLLVPTAWVPYFLPKPTAQGTTLAMVEKLVSMLSDPALAEFYRVWCRAACIRDATNPQQLTFPLANKPQICLLVEVSQFAEQKATRICGFAEARQQAQAQAPVRSGTLHEILLRLVKKQGGQTSNALT
eukprot:6965261-Ditylum_brightwellii.AAC.1